ncbi:MAG: asparaginase [Clostridia bacterium]|nr:asparaginase [Clostridia bacterium]
MKILLIATGGTIASVPSAEGLAPALSAAELLSQARVPEEAEVECLDLYSMDSSNIQPEEWLGMARALHEALGRCDAAVITHGTDTMAYTASMLSFLLQNPPIPILLTGSQIPILRPDSDGRTNLSDALLAATRLGGGVTVCFGGAIIKGCRAVKTRTSSLNAFESINYPYLGSVINGRCHTLHTPPERGEYRYYDALEPGVALIKLIPGTSPALLEGVTQCGIKGLVVEAFGLGGVHSVRRDHAESIRRIIEGGVPVVLSTQCLYEASAPEVYAVSRPLVDAGVIPAHDMTREAAVTKLMWALAQTKDPLEAGRLMRIDLCGEISPG